jgi:exopolysaccharide biosynthesis polyprenyl glycosylphosphotransferase
MATSDFLQKVSASMSPPLGWEAESAGNAVRVLRGKVKIRMAMDAITVVVSAMLAALYKTHSGPLSCARRIWRGTFIQHRSMGVLLVLLCFYAVSLILTSRRLNLYSPTKLSNAFQEQRLSVEACLTSGLLLTGTLYLLHAEDISRAIVLVTIGLVTLTVSVRRLIGRLLLYRNFERGVGTRNVLIVGTGPEAAALRLYLESVRHLGYRFKGFIEVPSSVSKQVSNPGDVIGTLDTLFQHARTLFVDEIFFTTRCERGVVHDVLEKARTHGVDLRMVPEIYDGVSYNRPIEFIGHFPTIPLYRSQVPEIGQELKRALDIVLSVMALILLMPLFAVIAIAIKLDSRGPVFYKSDRVGKKGRVFPCIKFRTMVEDAEAKRDDLIDMNERDGILFKITNDPRITKLGSFLRRHSLDELPQFINVLCGDMSVVGPRPLPARDVLGSKLAYQRVLAVTPGITGLWQVQGRQDPSSDSYISLNVIYIENWSVWLDIQIILRTIGAVFTGTGA